MKTRGWGALAVLPLALALAGNVAAEEVKGKVKAVSIKAGQISLTVESKGVMLFRVTEGTTFANAASIKEIRSDDLLLVDYRVDGFDNVAKAVAKVVAKLPEGITAMDTGELEALVAKGAEEGEYLLIDSRPAGKYNEAHIPTAVSIPFAELEKNPALLTAPKDRLLVFYCGGVTCVLSPKSAGLAKKSGYEKVRVYLKGEPEWKKAELPLESSLAFVEKGNIVLIDLRSPEKVAAGHIPGAVGIPAADLAAAQAKLPAYRGAHLVFYSDCAEDLSQALELARDWNYRNATIFPDGIGAWQKAGKHLKTGAAAATVTYVKKLAPGEAGIADFQAALKDGRTVVIDARAPGEFEKGHFKGAVNIPAEEAAKRLAEIPADRPVLVHCSTGSRAEMVYDLVKDKGYNLKYLKAGVEFAADGSYTISE